MIKLDDDLLQELGLAGLPPEEKKKLLAHIYETLEMRVGMKLAEQMSDAQLTEFEQFIDRNDEGGALQWLESNFPNYKDVVSSEFDRLKKEIMQVAPQILAAAQAAAAQPQADNTVPQNDQSQQQVQQFQQQDPPPAMPQQPQQPQQQFQPQPAPGQWPQQPPQQPGPPQQPIV